MTTQSDFEDAIKEAYDRYHSMPPSVLVSYGNWHQEFKALIADPRFQAWYESTHYGPQRHELEIREDDGWGLSHPMACRRDGRSLLDCETYQAIALLEANGVTHATGIYVVDDTTLVFTRKKDLSSDE